MLDVFSSLLGWLPMSLQVLFSGAIVIICLVAAVKLVLWVLDLIF